MTRPRLLVIDDEPLVAELVSEIGIRSGFDVTTTTDFGTFTKNYGADISVVTIDLMMPEIDGIEVIRFLAEQRSRAAIILISGVERRLLKTAAQLAVERELRLVGSISKPVDLAELSSLLASSMETARPPLQSESRDDLGGLDEAIAKDELRLLFQPKVNLKDGNIAGVEAVVRWQHPKLGTVQPDAFVLGAERGGQAFALTMWVAEASFAQAARWADDGQPLGVAINLPGRCLDDVELPDRLAALAVHTGVTPTNVTLEITESSIAENLATALDVAARLRLKGFELSLDDYGTGYATLEQLRQIPFNELKIAQLFVHGAMGDDESRRMLDSSIRLGHDLGLRVVAEGVETRAQWDMLEDLGCDIAQGYHVAMPASGEQVLPWLEQWRRSGI